MITKTTLSAVRALLHIARHGQHGFLSPRRIAEELGESPTYMAKVTRLLVRADLLRAEKGAKGGVRLGHPPEQIKLLAIVEACQGAIVGDFCQVECAPSLICAYHAAAIELHEAIVHVLSRWTVADLLQKPYPSKRAGGPPLCAMLGGQLRSGHPA